MERELEKIKKQLIVNNVVMFMLVALAITGVIFYYEMKTRMLVGGMYVRDPQMASAMMQELFSNKFTYNNLEMAREAAISGGYTDKAFKYLFWLSERKYIVIAVVLFIVIGMIIAIWKNSAVVLKELGKIKRELIKENESLKNELKVENEFVKKRNLQIQNFTENIAHQIKTPLTALGLKLELLSETSAGNSPRLEECFFQINRIKEFVKRMLMVSRMESGKVTFKKEKVVVRELIEEVILATAAEKNIICNYRLPENYTIQGDNDWLCESILNIVVNGLESVKDRADKNVYLDVWEEEKRLIITISDNGDGFKDKNINKVFDRFESNGSAELFHIGIGLNLSMLVVKAHYGNIFAGNSDNYSGAEFRIVLPQYRLKENL